MADFTSRGTVTPINITTVSRYGPNVGAFLTSNMVTANWTTANTAIYVPFHLPFPYTVRRMFIVNGGTVAGNFDVGLYTRGGVQLYHSGSTAQAGASACQYVTPGTAITLSPGVYYGALSMSSTSATVLAATHAAVLARLLGVYMESVFTLPASATFATTTQALQPCVGITDDTTRSF
jgi:hypothetical protein